MKTPAFWGTRNAMSALLLPAAVLYRLFLHLRQVRAAFPVSLPVPIICIGNLTAGGAGKTPVALYVGKRLKEKGINAYFLSRGYGGQNPGPLLVNPHVHTARETGDEALLLAKTLPTVISRDRKHGAEFAIKQGAQAIVMDDGFQNLSMIKTLSILVINGEVVFGNGRLLPAGPLREPVDKGLARAHAVVVIDAKNPIPEIPSSMPVLPATIGPSSAKDLRGKKVVAFCGIAYPYRFFNTVASLGASIVSRVSFSDHYLYTDSDMKKLVNAAKKEGALLVTTAKDAVRLTPEWRPLVSVVEVALELKEPQALDALLDHALAQSW